MAGTDVAGTAARPEDRDAAPATDGTGDAGAAPPVAAGARSGEFSGGVVVLFLTQVFGAGIGIFSGILLARLLGPTEKGQYYILTLIPATAMVLLQLGLPRAFGYYTARGITTTVISKAFVLSGLLTLVAFAALFVLLPFLQADILHGIPVELILFAFLSFPLAINGAFTIAVVMGRKGVRWYASSNILSSIAALVFLVVFLLALGPTVLAAIAAYSLTNLIQTVISAIGARRVTAGLPPIDRVTYQGLFRYGLPFYPGSLAVFFSYRLDAYLIAFVMVDAATALGYYSLAVGLAEIVFFFPRAVSTLYFPHVAGAPREESDRQVAATSRVTLLVTGTSALLMVPAATLMIFLVLPAYVPALPALYLLLPGVVAFSVTFVANGYLTGIDRPGITSTVSLISLVTNVVANLILIPRFGIVGAATASLFSYSLSSVLLTIVAARLTGTAFHRFWLPGPSDVRFAVGTTVGLLSRLRHPASVLSGTAGSR